MTVKLVYWDNIRGLAESSHLLLQYVGEPFEYEKVPLSKEGMQKWLTEVRYTPGLKFANMPFLVDGETYVSQSLAVLRYLARKFGLMPKCEEELVKCEMIEQEISDLKSRMNNTCYDPFMGIPGFRTGSETGVFDHEFLKNQLTSRLEERIPMFDEWLSGEGFCIGDNVCYVDFLVYEFLDQLRRFLPSPFEGKAKVAAFMNKVEGLKGINEYLSSDIYKAGLYINGPMAKWTGKE